MQTVSLVVSLFDEYIHNRNESAPHDRGNSFGFKQAVATRGSRDDSLRAAESSGGRVEATVAVLLDLDGGIDVSSTD